MASIGNHDQWEISVENWTIAGRSTEAAMLDNLHRWRLHSFMPVGHARYLKVYE